MARILITGVSGLLGINLALEVLREYEVIGLDRGKLKSAPFQVLKADLLQANEIDSVIESTNPKVQGMDGAVRSYVEYLYELGATN